MNRKIISLSIPWTVTVASASLRVANGAQLPPSAEALVSCYFEATIPKSTIGLLADYVGAEAKKRDCGAADGVPSAERKSAGIVY